MKTSTDSLSKKVRNLHESETLKMAQMARDMRAQGIDVINLSIGEPDFDTPEHIKEAAVEALGAGYTKYTPVPGLPDLKKAISSKFTRENNLSYSPDQIVVSNGAKQSIANVCMALLDPGDEAVIFAPYWVSYVDIVLLNQGAPVVLKTSVDSDFKVTPEQLDSAITSKTKFVLFSSPCNPTGTVYDRGDLAGLVQVLEAYPHVFVISDEIYEYINFLDHHISIGSFPSLADRVITVNGFSKGYAMTGWRLGYMGAPAYLARACTKIQGQFTSGASSFGQKAAITALEGDMEGTWKMRDVFRKRRDLVIEHLNKMPGVKCNLPDGAFYIFPDVSGLYGRRYKDRSIDNSNDFCEYLLQEAHVATVAGAAFGDDNCFRLSYAASTEELNQALSRISEAVSQLS